MTHAPGAVCTNTDPATQLLTWLGVHGSHVHFEGPHQGATAQQVLGVNHLPGRTTSHRSGGMGLRPWGREGLTDRGHPPPNSLWGSEFQVKQEGVWQGRGICLRLSISPFCLASVLLASRYM